MKHLLTGTMAMLSVSPSFFNTTETAIKRFRPVDRDCYLDQEFQLPNLCWSGGFRYSMMNCLYEGVLQKIISNCSCLHSSADFNFLNLTICTGKKLKCALDWMSSMGSSMDQALTTANNTQNHNMKCLQRCDLQTDTVSSSSTTFPNKETFFYRPEFCFVLQKISKICTDESRKNVFEISTQIKNICHLVLEMNNTFKACDTNDFPNSTVINANLQISEFMLEYASKNLAIVKIFYRDPYYTKFIKNEQISVLSFIANAGGLLGLCVGMSFLSIFEIVYHVVSYLFVRLNNYSHNTQNPSRNAVKLNDKY